MPACGGWGHLMGSAHRLRSCRLAIAGVLAWLTIAGAACDAQARAARKQPQPQASPAEDTGFLSPRYAAIVVDDKSGEVLHDVDADELRHPASLTKIMTLYLLFEQLEAGNFKLDTTLPVSAHAATQRPVKLNLKAGQTITVEDAIKGLVTKSANDAAAVIAEAIGGTEADFARLMTLKAACLGMDRTTYINASGLPAELQLTTARDQATLGRAIQHRFPVYYQYFATESFKYRGHEIRNHNMLLGQVQGVDGIKTGYTDASGYNLVSSVRRDQKHIVAVVLGGRSNGARDARMRQLIEEHIRKAAVERTAPIAAEVAWEDPAQLIVVAPALTAASGPAVTPGMSLASVPPGSGADPAQAAKPNAAPAKSPSTAKRPRQARSAPPVQPEGSSPPAEPKVRTFDSVH
jgi:D-alanyl-D-alanine carboxypeptidase